MQFFRFNLVVSAAILLMAGMLVAGCSKRRKGDLQPMTPPNNSGSNNTNTGSKSPLDSVELVVANTVVVKGNQQQINARGKLKDGTFVTFEASEVVYTLVNTGIGSITQNGLFSANTGNTGKSDLTVQATKNGATVTKTFADAIEVVGTPPPPPPSGSNPGQTGGNKYASNQLATSITLTNSGGNVDVGVWSNQLDRSINLATGGNTNDVNLIRFLVADRQMFEDGKVVVDAIGRVMFRDKNISTNIRAWAPGPMIIGLTDTNERPNGVTMSSDVSIASTGDDPPANALFISMRAFMSPGEWSEIRVWAYNGTDFTEVTANGNLSLQITSGTDRVLLVNNQAGQLWRLVVPENKAASIEGPFTVVATYNGNSVDFQGRVVMGNPLQSEFTDNGTTRMFVDTHTRLGEPYLDAATGKRVVPVLVALRYCIRNGTNQLDISKPTWAGAPYTLYNSPGSTSTMKVFPDEFGDMWGLHLVEYTGSFNIPVFQWVGFHDGTTNRSNWVYPQDINQSVWYGSNGGNEGMWVRVNFGANPWLDKFTPYMQ